MCGDSYFICHSRPVIIGNNLILQQNSFLHVWQSKITHWYISSFNTDIHWLTRAFCNVASIYFRSVIKCLRIVDYNVKTENYPVSRLLQGYKLNCCMLMNFVMNTYWLHSELPRHDIIFVSAHLHLLMHTGWQLGVHGEWGKYTNFEYATRVPLYIRVPGMSTGGQTTSALVEYVDLLPTLAEAAGNFSWLMHALSSEADRLLSNSMWVK